MRVTSSQSPWQNGLGERHGGTAKFILNKLIDSCSVQGPDEMAVACAEATAAKNFLTNVGGFSPYQW
eukprot:801984-Alexandrium_andersonii.AAC.1